MARIWQIQVRKGVLWRLRGILLLRNYPLESDTLTIASAWMGARSPLLCGQWLVAAPGPGAVGMGLDVAGVKHQPFIIRVIHHRLQQPGPDVPVPPAAEAAVGVLPIPVVRGQIPPGGAGAQNPEHASVGEALPFPSKHELARAEKKVMEGGPGLIVGCALSVIFAQSRSRQRLVSSGAGFRSMSVLGRTTERQES